MATCTELYIDTLGGLDLDGSTDKNLPYFVVENLATLLYSGSCGILTALQVRTVFGRFKAALLPHCVQRAGIFLNLIYDILCTLSCRITRQQTERYYSTRV